MIGKKLLKKTYNHQIHADRNQRVAARLHLLRNTAGGKFQCVAPQWLRRVIFVVISKEDAMSDGTDYEIFVQKLQQALLDSETLINQKNIKVERDKKIIDNNGTKRQFDLYWEYELAGVIYKTIIECKDYANPVSIEKIDALIGKIRDIPDLKPLFATKNGYQSGAETKAKANKIELLIVREQCDTDWEDKDGTPYFRNINIQICVNPKTTILEFIPDFDMEWLHANTKIPSGPLTISGVNNEIFIDDLVNGETYSLYDLANRLNSIPDEKYGALSHTEKFQNAFFIHNDLKLKIISYTVNYVRSKPFTYPVTIDLSQQLIGVIEYLSRGSATAIFKNTIIKNWR